LVIDAWWKNGQVKARNRSTFSVKSANIEKPDKIKHVIFLLISLVSLISSREN
jgi:hypothetical protein